MPILTSDFRAPWWLKNPHMATIVPSIYRKVEGVSYARERFELSDGDFLDLDWAKNGSRRLVILSHGLEGHTRRGYMLGTAKHFIDNRWDVLAWNCRSCSGEMNRLPRLYHHADVSDISEVINHAVQDYDELYLVGYSMGGSMSLNYLAGPHHEKAKAAAIFSTPIDLYSSVRSLSQGSNAFYRKRFLKKLKNKIALKHERYPELIDLDGIDQIETFEEFDNRYTAKLHGFQDAFDFYSKASTTHKLKDIPCPVLIVNALNDPFLGDECYPVEECRGLDHIYLETPKGGGHVGFSYDRSYRSYMDHRPLDFFNSLS